MKTIDLFSGAGGLSLGLKRAGFSVVACVEINRAAMDTYLSHDMHATHYNQDVRTVDFTGYAGIVDLVAGGPPCQPFSIGGHRRASADSRDMMPEFVRCLREVHPEAFIMENVPGMLLKKARPYFDSVLARLAACGYELNWAILDASDYGVPQKRRRLFIAGARNTQLRFPTPTHGPDSTRHRVTALEVLGKEPIGEPPNCPVRFARCPDLRPSPYAGHIYNGGGRPIDPTGPCHTVLASSGGYKTHWIDTQGVALEYHTHLMAGGAPREGIVPGARRLSVEECALIQTFPHDFRFSGTRSAQYTQVGDAVPPDLAFVVARALHSQMSGQPQDLALVDIAPGVGAVQEELAW